ncbi:hypothetical protein FOZ63_025929 [Perkinsus olseni]|uniref:Uncharacterized protein n=1 Tax=Perkinsus olseni TaxID=32597 RepID=A0A7J6SLQ0_PEROL|nr:hypothetical protein FOZ62_024210 [Perkinsus olseni]KAF4733868.1 hypothetical protein FOZ63_025929 [Perkinsus olseni]
MRSDCISLRLALVWSLALSRTVVGVLQQQQVPTLVGDSGEGTRYYFLLRSRGQAMRVYLSEGYHLNASLACYDSRLYQEPARGSNKASMYMYSVDDKKGSKAYSTSLRADQGTCFGAVLGAEGAENRTAASRHHVVATANSLCAGKRLLLAMEEQRPAPNGVYYGFDGDGLEVTVGFDRESRVRYIKVDDPDKTGYTELFYTMVGKALHGFFVTERGHERTVLMLEPVDPGKFNGSKKNFPDARLNTFEGEPVDSNNLLKILGLNKANRLERVRRSVVRGFRSIRGAAARLCTHGTDCLAYEPVVQNHCRRMIQRVDIDHGLLQV